MFAEHFDQLHRREFRIPFVDALAHATGPAFALTTTQFHRYVRTVFDEQKKVMLRGQQIQCGTVCEVSQLLTFLLTCAESERDQWFIDTNRMLVLVCLNSRRKRKKWIGRELLDWRCSVGVVNSKHTHFRYDRNGQIGTGFCHGHHTIQPLLNVL